MKITRAMLHSAQTRKGGYTNKQIHVAKKLTGDGKKCFARMVGLEVSEEFWNDFVAKSVRVRDKKKKREPSVKDLVGFYKKQKVENKPPKKTRKNPTKRQDLLKDHAFILSDAFYSSREWRELRFRVIKKYGRECACCGRNRDDHNIVIHVDHIKPRSKRPDLALCFENCQCMCEDCNLGKGNKSDDDFRPDTQEAIKALDIEHLLNTEQYH